MGILSASLIFITMELTAKITAHKIGVSRSRLSQIVHEMKSKLGAIKKVGNVQIFTAAQVEILRHRDKKPGPKTAHGKSK